MLDAIRGEAAASPDVEVCGLLLGEGLRVEQVVACRNVATEPATQFEIDPQALIAAHRTARGGGPAVIGHYHSHPTGNAGPSSRDTANAMGDSAIWIIVGGDDVSAWRSNSPGRLEPIKL
ncbi:MAG: M67 family metallopeptidase [Sphingomonas sp.]